MILIRRRKEYMSKKTKMDKRAKVFVFGACVILFVLLIIFAMYAGTNIGADIGEFIYNIKH